MDDITQRIEAIEKRLLNPLPLQSSEAYTLKEYLASKLDPIGKDITKLEERVEKLSIELKDLRTFKDNMEGKASTNSVILTTVLALAGLILSLVNLLR